MIRLIYIILIIPFLLISCKSPDAVVNTNSKTLKLISPVNGNYYVGDTVDIAWQSSYIKAVNLLYLNDSLKTSYVIRNNIEANANQYKWIIPNTIVSPFKIKIDDAIDSSIYDESRLITPLRYRFSFPIDIGYTWTYKYYKIQLNHDQIHFDTTTYNGIQKWDVISKQVLNDSTTTYSINSSEEDTVKADKTTIYYNNTNDETFYDTTYTIKSVKSFPIIVTKDTVYCMWNEEPVIPAAGNLVSETKVPLNGASKDTLKYSSSDGAFYYQVIYINGIGLDKIVASWYSMQVPQEGELDLISYNFK